MPRKKKIETSRSAPKQGLQRGAPGGSQGADELKLHLATRLPEMLSLALDAYDRITGQPAAEDPRAFTAQQGGAKAALAHMEALLKLAQSVMVQSDPAGQASTSEDGLSVLVQRAREAVQDSHYLPEEGDEIGGEV